MPTRSRSAASGVWPGLLAASCLLACVDGVADARRRADALLVAGDAEGAIRALRAVRAAAPAEEGAEALLRAARIERDALRRPQDAARVCRDVVARYPGTRAAARALFLLADILEKDLLRPRKAIEAYRMVEKDGRPEDREEARFRIGRCYLALQDPAQAAAEWRSLTAGSGGGVWRPEALAGIASAEYSLGRWAAARAAWAAVAAEVPGTDLAFRAREGEAAVLEAEGRKAQAEAALERLLSEQPPDPERIRDRLARLRAREERKNDER